MAFERESLAGHRQRHGIGREIRPEHTAEPAQQGGLAPLVLGREHGRAAALGAQGEAHPGLGDGQAPQHLGDGRRLRPVGFEELEPGRGRGKQVRHLDAGALQCRRRPDRALGTRFDQKAHALPVRGARGEGQPRDRPDRGQGLAAEAQRADAGEVAVGELGGGVALDREREVVRPHADAVIDDADEAPPTRLDRDLDRTRARIDGVLDQFLDRGSRPLDHLARGDAIDQDRIEPADAGTRRRRAEAADMSSPNIGASFAPDRREGFVLHSLKRQRPRPRPQADAPLDASAFAEARCAGRSSRPATQPFRLRAMAHRLPLTPAAAFGR